MVAARTRNQDVELADQLREALLDRLDGAEELATRALVLMESSPIRAHMPLDLPATIHEPRAIRIYCRRKFAALLRQLLRHSDRRPLDCNKMIDWP